MDRVKLAKELRRKAQSVRLNEGEWVVPLGGQIHPDHLETGLMVAHAGTAGAAEQVEDSELGRHLAKVANSESRVNGFAKGIIATFTLVSINAATPPIRNVQLDWAAPIEVRLRRINWNPR